jgi:hypothetical protein
MEPMNNRRLIFVRPPRMASLVPIYAALLLIAVISVVGLVAALWPSDRQPLSRAPAGDMTSGQPVEGVHRLPARPPDLPGRTRGI